MKSKNTWSLSPSSWSVIKKKMNEWTYFSFFRQWAWLYQRASWSCRHEDPAFSAPAWNSPNPKPASWHSASQRNESAKWTLPSQWQSAHGRSSCIDAPGIRETRTWLTLPWFYPYFWTQYTSEKRNMKWLNWTHYRQGLQENKDSTLIQIKLTWRLRA